MKIIECPRDAMQGIKPFIPTDKKAAYINRLLKVGFDTIDFGSFVSPEAIPQLRDTARVLTELDLAGSRSKLLAVVGNTRGAEEAAQYDEITYLGFPFSISDTFQKRNINSSVEDSYHRVKRIKEIADRRGKKLVVYISMAFGNPYGDPWDKDVVLEWAVRLHRESDIDILSLSDTIGSADTETIGYLFNGLKPYTEDIEIGAHLHTTPANQFEKIKAAYEAGCRRFDGAVKGLGGCPMAEDELTGNMPTESLIKFAEDRNIDHGLNLGEFQKALDLTATTFPV